MDGCPGLRVLMALLNRPSDRLRWSEMSELGLADLIEDGLRVPLAQLDQAVELILANTRGV